jgi:hypothetical protein
VTNPGRLDFDQHLAGFRTVELNHLDGKWRPGFVSNSCASLHGSLPLLIRVLSAPPDDLGLSAGLPICRAKPALLVPAYSD